MSTLWVFGYGSLVWNPGFDYGDSKVGFIEGYKRRFWQGNDIQRGEPGKLGRVVTLIEEPDTITWGRALQIKDEATAREYLDHRESSLGGYTTLILNFQPSDPKESPFAVLVYVALPSNKLYLGEAPYHEMAHDIATSKGNCGHNVEYLAKLAAFMRLNVPDVYDEHLFSLEHLVRSHLRKGNPKLLHHFDDAIYIDRLAEDKKLAGEREQEPNVQANGYQRSMQYTDMVHSRKLRCVKI